MVESRSQFVSRLPESQKIALSKLMNMLEPNVPDPVVASWFLKAEGWNPQSAAIALKKSEAWRREERVEELLREPDRLPLRIEAALDECFCPRVCNGYDREGRPILYVPYGAIDMPSLARRGIMKRHLLRRCIKDAWDCFSLAMCQPCNASVDPAGLSVAAPTLLTSVVPLCRYILAMEKIRKAIQEAPDPLAGHLQIADVSGTNPVNFFRSWAFFAEVSKLGNVRVPLLNMVV